MRWTLFHSVRGSLSSSSTPQTDPHFLLPFRPVRCCLCVCYALAVRCCLCIGCALAVRCCLRKILSRVQNPFIVDGVVR